MRAQIVVWVLACVAVADGFAQVSGSAAPKRWTVGATIGAIRYWGGTSEEATDQGVIRFFPYRPTPVGVRVELATRSIRLGLALEYAEPGLGGTGSTEAGDTPGGTIVLENFLTTYALTPSVSVPLARLRGGALLLAGFGLLLERWKVPGEPDRDRAGFAGTIGLELPLFGSWVGSATGSLGLTPASPFEQDDLPAPYRPAPLWRRGLSGGIGYRF